VRRLAPFCFALALTVACGGGSSTASSTAGTASVPRGSMNFITNAEVEAAPIDANTAYDIIARLRPAMMRPRNQTAGARNEEFGVIVFIEEVRAGDVESLRTIMRSTIYEIRYISATDATTRWGTGYSNGVIQVRLKR
jgi:hypothetical protein